MVSRDGCDAAIAFIEIATARVRALLVDWLRVVKVEYCCPLFSIVVMYSLIHHTLLFSSVFACFHLHSLSVCLLVSPALSAVLAVSHANSRRRHGKREP